MTGRRLYEALSLVEAAAAGVKPRAPLSTEPPPDGGTVMPTEGVNRRTT